MLLNLQPKTSGYAVHATVTGSYGEKMSTRVGRAYKSVVDAYLAQQRLLPKYPDAIIIDPRGVAVIPELDYPQLKRLAELTRREA